MNDVLNEPLLLWGAEKLGVDAGELALQQVAGDASSRRYYRLLAGAASYVLVQAPPATEKNSEFIAVQRLLADSGVRVPAIIDFNLTFGYMLLEDLGDATLLPVLNAHNVDGHYHDAFDILQRFASVSTEALPRYNEALLGEELSRFSQWFVTALLEYSLSAAEKTLLEKLDALLISAALAQPRVFVHRDFHSRNLMLSGQELAVIDFQDAVAGPVTYDLVSLLRDCYIAWPDSRVNEWALSYRKRLLDATALPLPDELEFMRWFDLMGLQRHLKVLGTFARLYLRDGKDAYLRDLPLVIHYVRNVLASYSAQHAVCAEASAWFGDVLKPLIDRQPWSTPA